VWIVRLGSVGVEKQRTNNNELLSGYAFTRQNSRTKTESCYFVGNEERQLGLLHSSITVYSKRLVVN
jgi:hypothetical protein